MSTEAAPRADLDSPSGGPDDPWVSRRWRLHRGGIVNIWQYAEHTFDLSGGRAIFQGTNGSGKSRTLELLLPLCLDGDLRQVGSKGFDTVSVRRLMLDEYPGGPNRIGYAWVELRRDLPDGGEEFLTCGVGVKASKTSQAISDSWRFVTTRRVGHQLQLVGPDRVPLGQAQLRDLLGADCVLDDQAFRAKIAATVYGVPAARYGDLLHLQRTLRNPDVGLKVLEGQLEQILSDALPPLDASLIERLATSFDDLESIRSNIVRLTSADKALTAFLSTYSGYALGSLRDRAESMRSARQRLQSLRTELSTLEEQVSGKQTERDTEQQRITELEHREGELEASIDSLRSHPAYTELQNLRDRERLVDSKRSEAVSALDTATTHRANEQRSLDSLLGLLRRLVQDTDAAGQAAQDASHQLATAGLDGTLVPHLPRVPAADAVEETASVRGAPEPDAEPVSVQRRHAPELDADHLVEAFRDAAHRGRHASSVAQQRGALTLSLHQNSVELDTNAAEVGEFQQLARQARLAATEAAGRRNQAHQRLAEVAETWTERARAWRADWPETGPASTEDSPAPEPPAVDDVVADRTAPRQAREAARAWARPQLTAARRVVSDVERELDDLRARCRGCEAELAELRSGQERSPERPSWADAERNPAAGAPLFQLVDFDPGLGDDERAGLEGALQASGLLNAWVTSDGALSDATLSDLLASPIPGERPRTAANTVLRAVSEPDCAVPESRITDVLASISLDGFGTALSVSTDGSWSAGVLHGTWRKKAAEYVGAGAREAARARRIDELEETLAELRDRTGDAESRHRNATDLATAAEQHLDRFPDGEDVLTAHANVHSAVDASEEADRKAAQTREQHDQAEHRWRAAQAELVQDATEAGLPAETGALDEAHRAATQARTAIDALRDVIHDRCLATLADLREFSLHHDVAVADRMAAESQADERCAEFAEHSAGLTELTSAVDGEAKEIADKVSGLERERADLRKELPRRRENISTVREAVARLETQLESKRAQLDARTSEVDTAESAFGQALRIPGLWAAANVAYTDEEATGPAEVPDVDEAADLLAASERKGSSESTVLNRLQTLQQSLAGNYDIYAGEHHGLLTVTVTGEEGPRPVAEATRLVSERLAEQRGYLNERYQSIFADYLIRDLAERLRNQIDVAEDLCKRMNEVLDGARSSQGVHVQLEWQPSPALGDDIKQAIELVRMPFADRSEDQDGVLRRVFTELIEAERDSGTGGYAEILSRALDYRAWYTFTVRVRDTGPENKPRVRRLRQLSSGETRLVSYVTLFAAAAAFYDAVSVSSGGQGPLRLVLLDEAFERLDDPTIARMLGLLVDLDMDWMITWPSGWGVSPKIPKMHIYDVLRPRSGHGIACTHTTWDGHGLERPE